MAEVYDNIKFDEDIVYPQNFSKAEEFDKAFDKKLNSYQTFADKAIAAMKHSTIEHSAADKELVTQLTQNPIAEEIYNNSNVVQKKEVYSDRITTDLRENGGQTIGTVSDTTVKSASEVVSEQEQREENQSLINYLKNLADNENDGRSANTLAVEYFMSGNLDGAIEYFEKAAQLDYTEGKRNLAILLDNDSEYTDDSRIFNLYQDAASQGDTFAINNLGCCYLTGQGTEQDAAKAVECFRKAAEKEDSLAQVNLGDCYALGNGVKQNEKKAFEMYEKAAKQNDIDGLRRLAECYLNGQGTQQNLVEAIKCYKMAANLGDENAQEQLQKIEKRTTPVKHNQQAMSLSEAIAEANARKLKEETARSEAAEAVAEKAVKATNKAKGDVTI